MKEVNCTALSSEVVEAIYNKSDLSLAAKGLFILLSCGFEDIDFSDPEYVTAFKELHDKRYLNFSLEELLRHLSKGGGNSVVIGIK